MKAIRSKFCKIRSTLFQFHEISISYVKDAEWAYILFICFRALSVLVNLANLSCVDPMLFPEFVIAFFFFCH